MNKFINCLLVVFFPLTVFCNTSDTTRPSRMQLGVIYSPDYNYRTLKATGESNRLAAARDTMEIPRFGYSAGFNFLYKITDKFAVEAEVLFADKGYQTKQYQLDDRGAIATLYKQPLSMAFVYHYNYLDVPVKLNYYFNFKKINFFITGGVSLNRFLYQTLITTTIYNDGSNNKQKSSDPSSFEKLNVAAIAGFGMNYQLTNKCSLKIEPLYKRSVTSVVNSPIKGYLYSFNLYFGIAYHF